MDLHKPKPWHSFREFLKEYLIIVVGVLTALGAEQGVEAWRWHEQVEVTRSYLLGELQISLRNAYERVAGVNCQKQRIAQLRDELLKAGGQWKGDDSSNTRIHGRYWDPPAFPAVYETPYRPFPSTAWQAALNNSAATHMSRKEAGMYSNLFRYVEHLYLLQEQEKALTPALRPLAYDLQLGSAERLQLLQALAQADELNRTMSAMAAQFLDLASHGPQDTWLKASSARQVEGEYKTCAPGPTFSLKFAPG